MGSGSLVHLVRFFQTISFSDSCYTGDTLKKGRQERQSARPFKYSISSLLFNKSTPNKTNMHLQTHLFSRVISVVSKLAQWRSWRSNFKVSPVKAKSETL